MHSADKDSIRFIIPQMFKETYLLSVFSLFALALTARTSSLTGAIHEWVVPSSAQSLHVVTIRIIMAALAMFPKVTVVTFANTAFRCTSAAALWRILLVKFAAIFARAIAKHLEIYPEHFGYTDRINIERLFPLGFVRRTTRYLDFSMKYHLCSYFETIALGSFFFGFSVNTARVISYFYRTAGCVFHVHGTWNFVVLFANQFNDVAGIVCENSGERTFDVLRQTFVNIDFSLGNGPNYVNRILPGNEVYLWNAGVVLLRWIVVETVFVQMADTVIGSYNTAELAVTGVMEASIGREHEKLTCLIAPTDFFFANYRLHNCVETAFGCVQISGYSGLSNEVLNDNRKFLSSFTILRIFLFKLVVSWPSLAKKPRLVGAIEGIL